MKIFNISVLVLVAGILSFTIVQGQIQGQKLHIVLRYVNIYSSAHDNLPSGQANQIAREKCERNGGPTAFNTAIESMQSYIAAVQSIRSERWNGTGAAGPDVTGKSAWAVEYFPRRCHVETAIQDHMEPLMAAIKPCLEPEERESADQIFRVSRPVLNLFCANNADRLISLYNADGSRDCPVFSLKTLRICMNITSAQTLYVNTLPMPWQVPLLVADLEDCNKLESLRVCVEREIAQCKNGPLWQFLGTLYDIFKRELGCRRLLIGEQTTSATNDVETSLSPPIQV